MEARFRASVAALALMAAFAGAAPAASAAKEPAACRGGLNGFSESIPAELPGTLEAPVLSEYAVFARPQAVSDQLPPLNHAGSSLEFRMTSYYPGEIRQLLALPDGRRYVAVPGFLRTFEVPSAICLPKPVRKGRAKLVEEETRRATQPAYCIVELGSRRPVGGEVECGVFGETAQFSRLFYPLYDSNTVVAMVPNVVSAVRVVYPRGPAVVASVAENAYLLSVPAAIVREQRKIEHEASRLSAPKHAGPAQRRAIEKAFTKLFHRLEADTEPVRVEWLGAGGAVLRTIKRPHPVSGLLIA